MLAGAAVSFAGPLGFVGLIIPHLVRFFVGHDNRIVRRCRPCRARRSSSCATWLARVLFAPYEVPVGILMACPRRPLLHLPHFEEQEGKP